MKYCFTCRFWQPPWMVKREDVKMDYSGTCHRYAPHGVAVGFPLAAATEWCGDHEYLFHWSVPKDLSPAIQKLAAESTAREQK